MSDLGGVRCQHCRRPIQRATGADLLPGDDEHGFFGIHFESVRGLGAHLAGQILAEAGVLRQGLNSAHFSSYGSEKKGTPVKSFVRFCRGDRDVRTSSSIESPQVVAVFHEALARSFDVAAGLSATGTLIVTSRSGPDEMRVALGLRSGTVAVLDALGIALEEKTRVNTAMLGAVVRGHVRAQRDLRHRLPDLCFVCRRGSSAARCS
jgi:pyruvate ferredoxin oxidoreductase gamma subunit